ncbi:MAG: hypothetical protein P1U34_04630 [Coxiellaceae bacterium]|nr:hypothetical protein [Coxiellaceae bacterium]
MASAVSFATELLSKLNTYITITGNNKRKIAAQIAYQRLLNTLAQRLGNTFEAEQVKIAQMQLIMENLGQSDLFQHGSTRGRKSQLIDDDLQQLINPPPEQKASQYNEIKAEEASEKTNDTSVLINTVKSHDTTHQTNAMQSQATPPLHYHNGSVVVKKEIIPASNRAKKIALESVIIGNIFAIALGQPYPKHDLIIDDGSYSVASEYIPYTKQIETPQFSSRRKQPELFTESMLLAFIVGATDHKPGNQLVTANKQMVVIDHDSSMLFNLEEKKGKEWFAPDNIAGLPNLISGNRKSPAKLPSGLNWNMQNDGYRSVACAVKGKHHQQRTKVCFIKLWHKQVQIEEMIVKQCQTAGLPENEIETYKTKLTNRLTAIKQALIISDKDLEKNHTTHIGNAQQQIKDHLRAQPKHHRYDLDKSRVVHDRTNDLKRAIENIKTETIADQYLLFFLLDSCQQNNPEILDTLNLAGIHQSMRGDDSFIKKYFQQFNSIHNTLLAKAATAVAQQYTIDRRINSCFHLFGIRSKTSKSYARAITRDHLNEMKISNKTGEILSTERQRHSRLKDRLRGYYEYKSHILQAVSASHDKEQKQSSNSITPA